jgi:hypothetical protein
VSSRALRFAARVHLPLWPAVPALLALALSSTGAVQGGWASSLAWWSTFSVGLPFVVAADAVAGWLGPGRGSWILPLAIPLGLLPYLAADLLVRRFARRRSGRPRP